MQAAMTGSTSNLKWSSAVRHAAEILVRRETATGKSGVCHWIWASGLHLQVVASGAGFLERSGRSKIW